MSENVKEVKKEQKDLDLLNKMKKLPGGLVIIPLLIAVILATFVPQVFQIGGYVTAPILRWKCSNDGPLPYCMWFCN